jgi:hypothetical protein
MTVCAQLAKSPNCASQMPRMACEYKLKPCSNASTDSSLRGEFTTPSIPLPRPRTGAPRNGESSSPRATARPNPRAGVRLLRELQQRSPGPVGGFLAVVTERVEHGVALVERPALHVLAREPHVHAVHLQRGQGQRLASVPAQAAALPHRLAALLQDLRHLHPAADTRKGVRRSSLMAPPSAPTLGCGRKSGGNVNNAWLNVFSTSRSTPDLRSSVPPSQSRTTTLRPGSSLGTRRVSPQQDGRPPLCPFSASLRPTHLACRSFHSARTLLSVSSTSLPDMARTSCFCSSFARSAMACLACRSSRSGSTPMCSAYLTCSRPRPGQRTTAHTHTHALPRHGRMGLDGLVHGRLRHFGRVALVVALSQTRRRTSAPPASAGHAPSSCSTRG